MKHIKIQICAINSENLCFSLFLCFIWNSPRVDYAKGAWQKKIRTSRNWRRPFLLKYVANARRSAADPSGRCASRLLETARLEPPYPMIPDRERDSRVISSVPELSPQPATPTSTTGLTLGPNFARTPSHAGLLQQLSGPLHTRTHCTHDWRRAPSWCGCRNGVRRAGIPRTLDGATGCAPPNATREPAGETGASGRSGPRVGRGGWIPQESGPNSCAGESPTR